MKTEWDFYFDAMLSTTTTVVEIKHCIGVRCPVRVDTETPPKN